MAFFGPSIALGEMLGGGLPMATTIAGGTVGAGGAAGMFGGLFGSANMMPMMMGAGMGMSAMQAFGGSSGGSSYPYRVTLSKKGKETEKMQFETFKKMKTGLMPKSLTAQFMGNIKKETQETARIGRGLLTSMAGGRTRGGGGIQALLKASKSEMQGYAAPAEWKKGQREEEIRNYLKGMQQIRDQQLQVARGQTLASGYKDISNQARRGMQGQALGDLAQMAMMMKVYG